jgi:hypothetical protein
MSELNGARWYPASFSHLLAHKTCRSSTPDPVPLLLASPSRSFPWPRRPRSPSRRTPSTSGGTCWRRGPAGAPPAAHWPPRTSPPSFPSQIRLLAALPFRPTSSSTEQKNWCRRAPSKPLLHSRSTHREFWVSPKYQSSESPLPFSKIRAPCWIILQFVEHETPLAIPLHFPFVLVPAILQL